MLLPNIPISLSFQYTHRSNFRCWLCDWSVSQVFIWVPLSTSAVSLLVPSKQHICKYAGRNSFFHLGLYTNIPVPHKFSLELRSLILQYGKIYELITFSSVACSVCIYSVCSALFVKCSKVLQISLLLWKIPANTIQSAQLLPVLFYHGFHIFYISICLQAKWRVTFGSYLLLSLWLWWYWLIASHYFHQERETSIQVMKGGTDLQDMERDV